MRDLNAGRLFVMLLCLMFIGLKLTGHIDWSWWWVLAPIWVPWAIWLACEGFLRLMRLFETPQERATRELLDRLGRYQKSLRR